MNSGHPTFTRLMQVAEKHGINTQAALARELNVLEQHITNWKKRGVPNNVIIDLSDLWGFRAKYVKDGDGEMRINLLNYLSKDEVILLEAREKLPDYAKNELLMDITKIAELIKKTKAANG